MNIALCGMMGCGKSTVAKILSQKLNLPLIDTDEIIVSRYGAISDIFDSKGEEFFRDLESQTIAKVCAKKGDCIIALGGGAVLREQNVRNLKSCGKIFFLRTKEENLVKRLENSNDRPLLRGTMRDIIAQILSKRTPIYEKAADEIIDTDGLTPNEIAEVIGEKLL